MMHGKKLPHTGKLFSLVHTDRPLSSSSHNWLARAAQELLAVTGPTGVDPGFSERGEGGLTVNAWRIWLWQREGCH